MTPTGGVNEEWPGLSTAVFDRCVTGTTRTRKREGSPQRAKFSCSRIPVWETLIAGSQSSPHMSFDSLRETPISAVHDGCTS